MPSLTFFESSGETVLLTLSLGPLVAGGLLAWTLLGASIDERRQMRWLALSLVTGVGPSPSSQLVRLLGLVEVGDGFLAALPRAVVWAALAAGVAATIVQPELGDAAIAVRRVAVGVGLVSILGAAGGLAWFAADATTAADRARRPRRGDRAHGCRPVAARPRPVGAHSPTAGCSARSGATPG